MTTSMFGLPGLGGEEATAQYRMPVRYLFIRRPVFAAVISIVLTVLGGFAIYLGARDAKVRGGKP